MNTLFSIFHFPYPPRRGAAPAPSKGFTLVEMIVAIGLFTIVLFIASSAFLAVLDADRKSRATRIAMDNLNLALEDMSRRIKTGTSYYCGPEGEISGTNNCPGGDSEISFTEQDGITRTTYRLRNVTPGDWYIDRITSGLPVRVTAPEIMISRLNFMVNGSNTADTVQPSVVIAVEGMVDVGQATSGFTVQTTVTQRAYDI